MDLRNLKVEEIKDLKEYYNVFGNLPFFEENNLMVTRDTAAIFHTAPICNRDAIFNYLKLVNLLFDKFDYMPIEIGAQLGIIDSMLESLDIVLDKYLEEDRYYSDSSNADSKGLSEFRDESGDNSNRIYYLNTIKKELLPLKEKLLLKLDDDINNVNNRKR